MDDLTLELESESELILENTPASGGTTDYEKLNNKPSIAGITLIGNKELSDFVADYIIIDGGDASGHAES